MSIELVDSILIQSSWVLLVGLVLVLLLASALAFRSDSHSSHFSLFRTRRWRAYSSTKL
jgi:hypothetical protein